MKLPVYLDNNSTTPCDPRVVEAMLPYFNQNFGNAASRSHSYGWVAEEAVKQAREEIAKLINADSTEIIFTSGATEADNLALKGVFETYAVKGNHIITIETEHNAVLDTCRHIEKMGGKVTYLKVNRDGLVNLKELEDAIKPATILIAAMFANNETGVIQPIAEIGLLAKKHGILFFSDATQAVGKIPVDVQKEKIDLMAFSAHKMYGPKGVGALFVRRKSPRVRLIPQMHGGGHEKGMRSGTLNVPAIVGFGKAAAIASGEMSTEATRLAALRDSLEAGLLKIKGSFANGNKEKRMPHIANVGFKGIEGEGLMMALNSKVALSSGSACTSASIEPSHVLKAMGLSDEEAFSSLRFSLGRFTTGGEIDFTIKQVMQNVECKM